MEEEEHRRTFSKSLKHIKTREKRSTNYSVFTDEFDNFSLGVLSLTTPQEAEKQQVKNLFTHTREFLSSHIGLILGKTKASAILFANVKMTITSENELKLDFLPTAVKQQNFGSAVNSDMKQEAREYYVNDLIPHLLPLVLQIVNNFKIVELLKYMGGKKVGRGKCGMMRVDYYHDRFDRSYGAKKDEEFGFHKDSFSNGVIASLTYENEKPINGPELIISTHSEKWTNQLANKFPAFQMLQKKIGDHHTEKVEEEVYSVFSALGKRKLSLKEEKKILKSLKSNYLKDNIEINEGEEKYNRYTLSPPATIKNQPKMTLQPSFRPLIQPYSTLIFSDMIFAHSTPSSYNPSLEYDHVADMQTVFKTRHGTQKIAPREYSSRSLDELHGKEEKLNARGADYTMARIIPSVTRKPYLKYTTRRYIRTVFSICEEEDGASFFSLVLPFNDELKVEEGINRPEMKETEIRLNAKSTNQLCMNFYNQG